MHSLQARPARCLITGASGFIGTRLCERFDEQGVQQYTPLVRTPTAAATLRSRWPQLAVGDLLNAGDLRRAMEGCDAVIHLAHSDRGPLATRRLVDCAIERGIRRFVHVSTMSVHGPAPGPEAAREETARIGRYDHDYSDSKAEQEEIVQAAHDRGDLQIVILRPTVVYGPQSHFVLQVVEQARKGAVTLFDAGVGICNAVYVDDVCDAIDASLVRTEAIGQAMFINADRTVSWGEFIRAFASMVEPAPRVVNLSSAEALSYWAAHPPLQVNSLIDRVGLKLKRLAGWQPPVAPWPPSGRVQREIFPISFCNDKAKRLLDWAPKFDFSQGVAMTRTWLDASGYLA
jgi:nucleoside-diphosphate-sugar epimerase